MRFHNVTLPQNLCITVGVCLVWFDYIHMSNFGKDTLRKGNIQWKGNSEKSSEILVSVLAFPLSSCMDKASVDDNHFPIYN